MGKPEIDLAPLTLTRATLKLVGYFVGLRQSRSADRVAEAFQPTIELARDRTVLVISAIQDIGRGTAFVSQAENFHDHEFGN